jgi:hypothetical protein
MKYLLLGIVTLILSFIGCTTTKYVEVPVDKVRIEYRDRIHKDTFFTKDSIFLMIKGDTVFKEKYIYRYKVKELRDTIVKVDTLTQVQVVSNTKEVNKLKTWQIVLMILGGGFIMTMCYKIFKFI